MLSHMDEVLGTRYCELTAMKANMMMTRAMQLIMKGTFNHANLAGRGCTGTRWQMLDELVLHCLLRALPRALARCRARRRRRDP